MGPGHFPKISNFQTVMFHPFKMDQTCVQMIPNGICDTFQPILDFLYGLDVEIRPKLTPGAGTPRWAQMNKINLQTPFQMLIHTLEGNPSGMPCKLLSPKIAHALPIPPPRVDSSKCPTPGK